MNDMIVPRHEQMAQSAKRDKPFRANVEDIGYGG